MKVVSCYEGVKLDKENNWESYAGDVSCKYEEIDQDYNDTVSKIVVSTKMFSSSFDPAEYQKTG